MEDNNKKYIELRSEKVRNIIGQVPPVLLRYGTIIISVVLLLLVIIAAFVPYRKSISINVTIHSTPQSILIKSDRNGILFQDSIPQNVNKGDIITFIATGDSLIPIYSPISGKIIVNVWNRDSVRNGDLLFAIIPDNLIRYYGTVEVSNENFSKITEGNKVIIKDMSGNNINGRVATKRFQKLRIEFDKESLSETTIPETELSGIVILSDVPFLKRILKNQNLDEQNQ
ncbi:MAG: HlyD family secretion protein [Rikenellaceae bacterium]